MIYCYKNIKTGERLELNMSVAAMQFFESFHTELTRDFQAEIVGTHRPIKGWPKRSVAVGVHPKQVRQAREYAKQHGLRVDYAPNGDAIFQSKSDRDHYGQKTGFRDISGAPIHASRASELQARGED